jgi:hypothetical protein
VQSEPGVLLWLSLIPCIQQNGFLADFDGFGPAIFSM